MFVEFDGPLRGSAGGAGDLNKLGDTLLQTTNVVSKRLLLTGEQCVWTEFLFAQLFSQGRRFGYRRHVFLLIADFAYAALR